MPPGYVFQITMLTVGIVLKVTDPSLIFYISLMISIQILISIIKGNMFHSNPLTNLFDGLFLCFSPLQSSLLCVYHSSQK